MSNIGMVEYMWMWMRVVIMKMSKSHQIWVRWSILHMERKESRRSLRKGIKWVIWHLPSINSLKFLGKGLSVGSQRQVLVVLESKKESLSDSLLTKLLRHLACTKICQERHTWKWWRRSTKRKIRLLSWPCWRIGKLNGWIQLQMGRSMIMNDGGLCWWSLFWCMLCYDYVSFWVG